MVIKVFISGITGNQEVRKQQQRVLFILQSLPIDLQVIDVTEPGKDEDLALMQNVAKEHNKPTQLPPQIFNDQDYCGDYADFEVANDDDELMKFLKLEDQMPKSNLPNPDDLIISNGTTNNEDKDSLDTTEKNITKSEMNSVEDFVTNEAEPDLGTEEGDENIAND